MPRSSESAPEDELLTLAIETSNPSVSAEVAVGFAGASSARALAVVPLREVGRNEDDLLPAIDRACAASGVGVRDLARVAVSVGPGGYTSLRVACAVAKMIAEATGAACVPVPTAAVVAHAANRSGVRLGVCLAGKDNSIYLTVFNEGAWRGGTPVPTGRLVDASSFPFDDVDVVVADKHLPGTIRDEVQRRDIRIEAPQFSAASCLQLSGLISAVDPAAVVPVYPREPDAVTLWRKRHDSASIPRP